MRKNIFTVLVAVFMVAAGWTGVQADVNEGNIAQACSYITNGNLKALVISNQFSTAQLSGYCSSVDKTMPSRYGQLSIERLDSVFAGGQYARRTYSYGAACFATAKLLKAMNASELLRFLMILSLPMQRMSDDQQQGHYNEDAYAPFGAVYMTAGAIGFKGISPIFVLKVELDDPSAHMDPKYKHGSYAELYRALFEGDDKTALQVVRKLEPSLGDPHNIGYIISCQGAAK